MIWIRRIFSTAVLVTAIVGSILALVGIERAWTIRTQFVIRKNEIHGRIDESLVVLEERTSTANAQLAEVRTAFDDLHQRVQDIVNDVANLEEADVPLDELERQIRMRLNRLQDFIAVARSSTDLIDQLMFMLEQTTTFAQQDSKSRREWIVAVRSARDELETTFILFESLELDIAAVRAGQAVENQSTRITSTADRIGTALKKIEEHGQRFESGIAETRTELTELSYRLDERVLQAAISLTLLLLWLTAAQCSLGFHAWGWLQITSDVVSESPDTP